MLLEHPDQIKVDLLYGGNTDLAPNNHRQKVVKITKGNRQTTTTMLGNQTEVQNNQNGHDLSQVSIDDAAQKQGMRPPIVHQVDYIEAS